MNKIRKYICVSLILCLPVISVFSYSAEASGKSSITSDSIKEKEDQIDNAKKEKENLQNNLTDIKKMKKELEEQKGNLADYVKKLDADLAKIEKNINELKQMITEKEENIAQTENELLAAQVVEEEQYSSMKEHIKVIYERGDSYIWDVLMSADSFGDILNKMDYVQQLYDYDQRLFEEYQTNRIYVELCMEQLEIEKTILDEQKRNVEAEQAALEDLISEKGRQIASYDADITNKEQAIREYEEEIRAQDEAIAALEAAVAEERRRILANSGKVLTYDGGVFKFPMASYTRMSDDYGNRIHPTLGVQQFHNGVDFAAPKGTAIYAAYDGVVVAATYSATMGNYIMLDHGDGLYTIYMHASALYVSKDDAVVRGDTIAAVGSTGRSTGNHLHFSVRLNGSYVSPWNYLSQ